jgi:hypothetical protein
MMVQTQIVQKKTLQKNVLRKFVALLILISPPGITKLGRQPVSADASREGTKHIIGGSVRREMRRFLRMQEREARLRPLLSCLSLANTALGAAPLGTVANPTINEGR